MLSHLPVIVDPSHAAGLWWMVAPLAKAAVAVGADGLIIEVHQDPDHALCDGAQSLKPKKVRPAYGRAEAHSSGSRTGMLRNRYDRRF